MKKLLILWYIVALAGCFGSHLYLTIILLQVGKRLLEQGKGDATIPSITTLRYQFNPSYLKRKTASKYKGRFDVVCKIQRRQIRKFYEDAHYVNGYFL